MGSVIFVAAIVLLDQLSKYWAKTVLQPLWEMPLIPGIVKLTYAENTGAAFSLLRGGRWIFIAVTGIVLIVAIGWLRKGEIRSRWGRISLLMVIGGAIGNAIDRVLHGYVVDMVNLEFIHFAIFNVADAFITVGGALLLIYLILEFVRTRKDEKNGDQ